MSTIQLIFMIMLIFFFYHLLFTIYYFHCMYYCLIVSMLIFFAKSQKNYSFHCIYVYVYWIYIYYSSMFIYFVVCQLYHMSYWLSAKNSIISSIVFRQCSSCFIDFSILLEMVLTKVGKKTVFIRIVQAAGFYRL